jgi:RHS repeat-associated protein
MPSAQLLSEFPSINAKRDPQGRIAERAIRLTGRLGDSIEVRRYAYDAAGRLSRVTDDSGALRESYQYDQQGRRLADINPARFRGERRYSYGPGNRLGQAGSAQYGHDRAGFRSLKVEASPQGQAETRYHYEPSGLLLAVELPDGKRIQYAYDASGQRTEKRMNGQVVAAYRWLDPLRLSEFHDGDQWWRLAYLPENGQGRTPVGLTNGQDSYFLLCDQVGTPLALATTDGHVVQAMQYDSFGNMLSQQGNVVRLPLGFAGGLYDADTGLTRFPWRDYDADTGRFTALDPLGAKGGDTDWYGYCVDDPVNRVDVWGLHGDTEEQRNDEYKECVSSARWWDRQCKQLSEFGSYVVGEKWPLRGWGVGEAGDWLCKQIHEGNEQRCEDEHGPDRKAPDTDSPPSSSD